MPFLGVYDNVLVQALIVPLHTYQHWGWGFVSEHFVPQVFFSRLPKSEGWQIRTPSPFLYLYTNRREFVELYWQKMIEVNMKCLEYLFYILGCLIMLYYFVDMIVQKIQGASNIYTQYNIPLWIIVGIGFVLIGRTIALQRAINNNK